MALVSVGAGAVGNRTYHLRCDRDFFNVRRYKVKGSVTANRTNTKQIPLT